jgi:hypothetical protein
MHKGDRKGRPYRRVPRMRPMTDRTGDHTGDRKGRPYRRVPRMRPMTDHTGDHKGDRKGRPYRRVPRMRPMTDRTGDRNPTGDPVGAPLAGAHNGNQWQPRATTMATKGDRKGRPYRCVPRMRP